MYGLDKIRIDVRNFCSDINKEWYLNWAGLTGLASDEKTHEFFLHGTVIKATQIQPFFYVQRCPRMREDKAYKICWKI
jgi:hypothetical protein